MLYTLDMRAWQAEDFDKGLKSYKEARKACVKVRGVTCAYIRGRVDMATLPEGFQMYEVGSDRRNGGNPSLVKRFVSWPFFGTLVAKQELPLGKNHAMRFDLGDWQWMRKGMEESPQGGLET